MVMRGHRVSDVLGTELKERMMWWVWVLKDVGDVRGRSCRNRIGCDTAFLLTVHGDVGGGGRQG